MNWHIQSNCVECTDSAEFWQTVAVYLGPQPVPQVPSWLLTAAQELFSSRRPWAWLRSSAEWAKAVFDNFQSPALAFVRGPMADIRHLIYEAEPFVIDVTLKSDPTQTSLWLMGQVLNSRNSGHTAGDEIHIVLLSGEDLVAKTVASTSGEFELSCEMHSNLSLFISVRGERAIGLSLADSGKAASA